MEKKQKLGLALIALGCFLAAFCGVSLYYVNRSDAAPAWIRATEAPTESPAPTLSPSPMPEENRPPVLTLIGDDPLFYTAQPGGYADPGCTASDDRDGDLTAQIVCAADVNAFHAGEGSVTYTVTDSEGLTASVTRRVIVTAAERPSTVVPEGRTVYLTFDDGPSANTERLLDTLDAYGVKATFFVTNCNEDYTGCIGEIARRGHTVAIHSATHDYRAIYQSEEAYFADLCRMQEIIFEQTGEYARLVRFPGGSSNTVSCYNPGIMSRLTSDLNDMGYAYFDWNVSAADTASNATRYTVIENIKEGVPQHDYSVVLQHDTNGFSVDAVEEILAWGIQNGYSFRALDLTSPAVHHSVAN